MKLRLLVTTAALFSCTHAAASGVGPPTVYFAHQYSTDIALDRYQKGELGVVRPGYHRVYLYTAWRAIALGEKGLKAAPNQAGGLRRALGDIEGGWSNTADSVKLFNSWQAQIDAALKQTPAPANREFFSGFVSCPAGSYKLAITSLADLARRSDATPGRLGAWVAAQRELFKFCGDGPPRKVNTTTPIPPPRMPAPLPASEPLHWRQMQQYQLAAAAFHGEQYDDSAARFAQIGATAGHPLRHWGAYLQLRSMARRAAQPDGDVDLLEAIGKASADIVANPSLAALHEDARAVLRSAQAAVEPEERFETLSALLDRPAANPFVDDYLGDWRVLAGQLITLDNKDSAALILKLRKAHGFFDWIQTLRECQNRIDQSKEPVVCSAEQKHAAQQWHDAVARRDQPGARLWLTASAILAGKLHPELEQAALQVPAQAPEYLTIRYALARHYRLAGQADKARVLGDEVLGGAQLRADPSDGARNLFRQERFGVASSVSDAAPFLARKVLVNRDDDSGETATANLVRPADDGLQWLNSSLSVAELGALGADARIPLPLRNRILVAAWMRAGLLGDMPTSLALAGTIEKSAPELAAFMQQYRNLPAAERTNAMLVSAMRHGLSPTVGNGGYGAFTERSKEDSLADMWCAIAVSKDASALPEAGTVAIPAADAATGAARASELAALKSIKTASGYVGDYALARAAAQPDDPDLPWMLHTVVKSTRGGCLDADASTLSRTAFGILHKRYKKSEWTTKTRVHY